MNVKSKNNKRSSINANYVFFAVAPMLAACTSSSNSETDQTNLVSPSNSSMGLPISYQSPISNYLTPSIFDQFSFSLTEALTTPYWSAALLSGTFDSIKEFSKDAENSLKYAFPTKMPDYYVGTEYSIDWIPATYKMQDALESILATVSEIVDLNFSQTQDITANNVIVLSASDLDGTIAGFSYYPHPSDPLGSDVFIDISYLNPSFIGLKTNYDYELLVHELGHALGLKHPFSAEGASTVTLPQSEDNSNWTAMTYDEVQSAFSGSFRSFDLMALVEIYGVNPNYRSSDDTYYFSSKAPTFVIDGAGTDTISAEGKLIPAHIDLREGSWSSLGDPSQLVSVPNQLVISSGSLIENAIGGNGNDTLHGNSLDNYIFGGLGEDRIFSGEGADFIDGGAGPDMIDVSETNNSTDTISIDINPSQPGADNIFGFVQGVGGDVLDFKGVVSGPLQAVVTSILVPVATVSNVILRLAGEGLDTTEAIGDAFSDGGAFENIDIASGSRIFIISAGSQETGEDQCLSMATNFGNSLDIDLLAVFKGNYLDIDSWHNFNFA